MLHVKIPLLIAGNVPYQSSGPSGTTSTSWPGGQGIFSAVSSNWNGATISLQFLGPDGATLVTAGTGTTFTANNAGIFYLPPCQIVATVTGSPTAAYATAERLPV